MVKKLIIISSGLLFLLIVLLTLISFIRTKNVSTDIKRYISPTPIDVRQNYQGNNYQNALDNNYSGIPKNQNSTQESVIPSEQQLITLESLKQSYPFETPDFSMQYSKKLDTFVIIEKTSYATEALQAWLQNKGLSNLINNIKIFVFTKKPFDEFEKEQSTLLSTNGAQPIIDLIKIFFTFPKINPKDVNLTQQTNIPTSPTVIQTSQTGIPTRASAPSGSGGFTYYPQCNGPYDNYPLPGGCTVCKAGCGPTTVSMIVASYVDRSVTPLSVVDTYVKNGYILGCDGSGYMEARSVLSRYGIKTTDILSFGGSSANAVVREMRNYIQAGWTFFALANYCEGGCGHFFWITDIDESGNVWAYDPYYGKSQAPPINENRYDPFPRYRIAFGVKKP